MENVASRLNLTVLAYLWERNQSELLREMVEANVFAILIKVACVGLSRKHLSWSLGQIEPTMLKLHDRFGVHPCGEGGEYETIVLDCPLFTKSLVLSDQEVVQLEGDTAYLKLKAELQDKSVSTWHLPKMNLDPGFELILDELSPVSAQESINVPLSRSLVSSTASYGRLTSHRIVSSTLAISQAPPLPDTIIFCQLVISSMDDFASINQEYAKLWSTTIHPPARICFATPLPEGVKSILHTISISHAPAPLARKHKHAAPTSSDEHHSDADDDDDDDPEDAPAAGPDDSRLWVQSQSYWAPANIGPYSQSVTTRNGLHLTSGSIGLVPRTMVLADTVHQEICWAIQSMIRIVRSSSSSSGPGNGAQDLHDLSQDDTCCRVVVVYTTIDAFEAIECVLTAPFVPTFHERVVVRLPRGSQLPRQASVECQYIAAARSVPNRTDSVPAPSYASVNVTPTVSEARAAGDAPALGISFYTAAPKSEQFWGMHVDAIRWNGRAVESCSINITA